MQKTSKTIFLYLGKFLWKGSPEGRLETKILENAVRRGGSPKWKAEKVKGFLYKVNTQKSFFSKIWAKTKNDGDHFDFAFWPKFWKKTFFATIWIRNVVLRNRPFNLEKLPLWGLENGLPWPSSMARMAFPGPSPHQLLTRTVFWKAKKVKGFLCH